MIKTDASYFPPAPQPPPESARPAPSPAPRPPTASESPAREALRKADEFARANPSDLKNQEARYREALKACEGSPLQAEAKARLDDVRRKLSDAFAADLAALDEQTRAACGREEFKKAADLLEQARKKYPDSAWTTAVDQKILQVTQEAWKVYTPLRDKAVDAHRRGSRDETQAAVDRVKRWGLEALITDLDKALTAPPKPPPDAPTPPVPPPDVRPPSAEASAYAKAWEAAAALMALHDFGRAAHDLDDAAKAIENTALREEAASDLESFRRAGDLHREALLALSKWPRGQKLRLACLDENGEKTEIEGTVNRADALAVELVRNRKIAGLPLQEVLPGSMIEALKGRPGGEPPADPRAAVTLCLLEGDLEGARNSSGDPPYRAPEKYWTLARKAAEARGKGASAREAAARQLFWAAEREFRTAGTRARAIEKASSLLSEHAASPLVRRNRGLLTQRMEAGKDYFFTAGDLASSGAFTLAQYPKVDTCWTVESDVPRAKAKNTFAELEFYALPETAYRCWVHAGGCCAETFTFYYQATDLSTGEPGSDTAPVARHQILFLKKFHVQHGGAKEPARWEWVSLPLPKYSMAGIKKIRFISDQQGFSVAHTVVSSTRQNFPRDQELKDMEKALAAERPDAEEPSTTQAPSTAPSTPEARPWRAVFDGRTTDCLTRASAAAWRVEDGALAQAPGADTPGETTETFTQGDIRIRFEAKGLESLFFKILQGPEGGYRIAWDQAPLQALEGKPHELVFTCRKDTVTAELDGKTAALAQTGEPKKGFLQFGAVGKSLRIFSIEHR